MNREKVEAALNGFMIGVCDNMQIFQPSDLELLMKKVYKLVRYLDIADRDLKVHVTYSLPIHAGLEARPSSMENLSFSVCGEEYAYSSAATRVFKE
jgi:hypothetical protein